MLIEWMYDKWIYENIMCFIGIQDRVQKQEDKLHMTEAAYGQLQENVGVCNAH